MTFPLRIPAVIKSPSFSATAIFALALGIGATTAMFAVIYAFLLRPLPYASRTNWSCSNRGAHAPAAISA